MLKAASVRCFPSFFKESNHRTVDGQLFYKSYQMVLVLRTVLKREAGILNKGIMVQKWKHLSCNELKIINFSLLLLCLPHA